MSSRTRPFYLSALSQMGFIIKLAPAPGSAWLPAAAGYMLPPHIQGGGHQSFRSYSFSLVQTGHLPNSWTTNPNPGTPVPRLHWGTWASSKLTGPLWHSLNFQKEQIYLSVSTHNSAIKLFGPNCLISKSVRFEGFVGVYFVYLFGLGVFWWFVFVFCCCFDLEAP